MRKIFESPITYILLIVVLFSVVSIHVGNVITTLLGLLIMIVFFGMGNMGKDKREELAKSIGGGGIKRPKDPDKDPNVTP